MVATWCNSELETQIFLMLEKLRIICRLEVMFITLQCCIIIRLASIVAILYYN